MMSVKNSQTQNHKLDTQILNHKEYQHITRTSTIKAARNKRGNRY
jgi:hypothetical protein